MQLISVNIGLYCRVIQEGKVRAGMPVTIEHFLGAQFRSWKFSEIITSQA